MKKITIIHDAHLLNLIKNAKIEDIFEIQGKDIYKLWSSFADQLNRYTNFKLFYKHYTPNDGNAHLKIRTSDMNLLTDKTHSKWEMTFEVQDDRYFGPQHSIKDKIVEENVNDFLKSLPLKKYIVQIKFKPESNSLYSFNLLLNLKVIDDGIIKYDRFTAKRWNW